MSELDQCADQISARLAAATRPRGHWWTCELKDAGYFGVEVAVFSACVVCGERPEAHE